MASHNHIHPPFAELQPRGWCPRCDELRAARETSGKTQHSHAPKPFGRLVAPGVCARCDELRAERTERGETQHNHEQQPFGRRKPPGECPRCDELHDGAPRRETARSRDERLDREHAEDIRKHFASDKHLSGGCGPVCTYGQW